MGKRIRVLLSNKQVIEARSLVVRTVELLISKGALSACQVGKRVLVPRIAIAEFVARNLSTDNEEKCNGAGREAS